MEESTLVLEQGQIQVIPGSAAKLIREVRKYTLRFLAIFKTIDKVRY